MSSGLRCFGILRRCVVDITVFDVGHVGERLYIAPCHCHCQKVLECARRRNLWTRQGTSSICASDYARIFRSLFIQSLLPCRIVRFGGAPTIGPEQVIPASDIRQKHFFFIRVRCYRQTDEASGCAVPVLCVVQGAMHSNPTRI